MNKELLKEFFFLTTKKYKQMVPIHPVHACSVMSDSVIHGTLPARFLCSWDFPGKNAGVGYHFLLQGIFPTQDQTRISYLFCVCRRVLYH